MSQILAYLELGGGGGGEFCCDALDFSTVKEVSRYPEVSDSNFKLIAM